jgi:hypothetical protein
LRWHPQEKHILINIPANVDESELSDMVKSGGHASPDLLTNCVFWATIRSGKQTCGEGIVCNVICSLLLMLCTLDFTHVVDGEVKKGTLCQHRCSTKMVIWASVEPDIHAAFIILQNAHTHSMPYIHKPLPEDQHKLKMAIAAHGVLGLTTKKLLHGER